MITINGKKFKGNSISVSRNKIIIDGKDCTPDAKEINIIVNNDISELKIDVCDTLKVKGNVGSIQTQSGDVKVEGDVTGNISTMSGDVDCYEVGGNISTMSGDIKHRKR